MLDYFAIFTKGGALLWTIQFTALRGNPIDALIRSCLLEERLGESSFTYTPPSGTAYTLKWTLQNALGLVFVAVYQRALKLLYVDDLLERVKQEFAVHYKPNVYDYKQFEKTFQRLLKEAEDTAVLDNQPPKQGARSKQVAQRRSGAGSSSQRGTRESDADGDTDADRRRITSDGYTSKDETKGNAAGSGREDVAVANGDTSAGSGAENGTVNGNAGAFDTAAIVKKAVKRPPGAKLSKKALQERSKELQRKEKKLSDTGDKPKAKKEARKWGSGSEAEDLDFSEKLNLDNGEANGKEEAVDLQQRSLVDIDEDVELESESDDEAEQATKDAAPKSGLLASFVRNIGVNVVGTAALTREDIQPALTQLRRKLMERNVAEEIAAKVCESVAMNLVGKRLGSFTRVSSAVRQAVEESITRILTPKRSIDVLREAQAAKAKGRPYVIVFVGVNGVGKSTNLAKVAYWLLQNNMKVQVAACDTFRSGAVEQLRTHCKRLDIPLFEQGYQKDPAKVAYEAVKAAQRNSIDVVLVDTAGRMQDNEPLMRALSNLINLNEPDLTLFVGEALVGNDAVDQLTKFNQRLADLARTPNAQMIQGLVLTKMDTIDDKVGAALSMVYVSGAPIMFVGCGQTYVDLKRLNVKSVVRSLLK
jgi:signal recognition particle receptor subunit alpha